MANLLGGTLVLAMTLAAPIVVGGHRFEGDDGSVAISETMQPERTDFTCSAGGPAGLAVVFASVGLLARRRRT